MLVTASGGTGIKPDNHCLLKLSWLLMAAQA